MVYYAALERYALNQATFETTATMKLFEELEKGRKLPNLFQTYRELRVDLDAGKLNVLRDSVYSDDTGLTVHSRRVEELPAGITFPALSRRLARISYLPFKEKDDQRPARDLLINAEEIEKELTAWLITNIDEAMESARNEAWQQQQFDIQIMQSEYENRQDQP